MPPNRGNTLDKLNVACAQVICQWKKACVNAAKRGQQPPKPLSIMKIAKVAGISSKTIHVNPDFKEIVRLAIAQTQQEDTNIKRNVEFAQNAYSRQELQCILDTERKKNVQQVEVLLKRVIEAEKKCEELRKTNSILETNLMALIKENANLSFENDNLRMRMKQMEGV